MITNQSFAEVMRISEYQDNNLAEWHILPVSKISVAELSVIMELAIKHFVGWV